MRRTRTVRKLTVPALLAGLVLIAGSLALVGQDNTQKAVQGSNDDQVRIAYVYSDGNMPLTLEAYKQLIAERPDLRDRVELSFLTESMYNQASVDDLADADVLVLDVMNQQMLDRFDGDHGVNVIEAVRRGQPGKGGGTVLGVGEGLAPREFYTDQGVDWDERARAFWANSGLANQLGLMKLSLARAGVQGLTIPEPQVSLDFGYYYPDGSTTGRVFPTWDAFNTWHQANGKTKPGAPRVALGFYKASYYTGDTELLNALIAEIEAKGAEAVPFFGYPDGVAFTRMLLDDAGNSRADVALSLLFRFANFDSATELEKLNIPVINLVSLYGRSEQEWHDSDTGLSMFEGTFQVAVPELAGLTAPTVVGSKEKVRDPETGLTVVMNRPIASQVPKVVERGLRYAALSAKPNAEKKLALVYYNYPAGKAGIGASYLNVAESLSNILNELKQQGYNIGDEDLSADALLEAMTTKARNVGGFAPGELKELIAQGGVVRVPMAQYRQWLDGYAPELKAKILKDWGPPEDTRLMSDGDILIPALQYGNIVLMPQPARGWGEDEEALYHADDLAPHHQYVAAYAWLKNEFQADAVVHIGTHGTLEWLDGKDMGLSDEDAPDALITTLPDIYIYNVDVVGEGLVARRRGEATLVDHMVPPFRKGGLYPELAELNEKINDFDVNLHKNPELAEAFADEIREQVEALGIAKDLSLDLSKLDDPMVHKIQHHMDSLREQNIPYGMHAFGHTPPADQRATTVNAITSTDRSLLPDERSVFAEDMDQRIIQSGPRELANLMNALNGGFVPTGSGGEPIRNPDSYPTGKNFYGVDPDKVPKKASWEMGVKLADEMLADHLEKHGKYPEKISFVIWGDETMRHEGVTESQILWLLGARPVWNDRDKVIDVEVIPQSQLGRPRVDIVIASAAEGMFNNITVLMDKAVQQVKAIEEADNYVRQHYLETKQTLISRGYSEEDADKRAGVRIFDEPPGSFNLNTSSIVAASGTWETDAAMADEYLQKMGHGFGNGFWGESMEDVFRLALSGTEKVVHSSSTMLYGALDNDDMYMYMGGLATAIRNIDGSEPELVIANTRDPGNAHMSTMDEFIGTEFRSRYANPTWIEGMQKEGYAGAGAMKDFVEYLWGWDATATEVVDDAMWKETFDVYVDDKYQMGMKQWFQENSPYAAQDIDARMLETIRKGYWNADDATQQQLLESYLENVNENGVNCVEFTCGNPKFLDFVVEQAAAANLDVPLIDGFRTAVEQATERPIPAAAALENLISENAVNAPEGEAPGEAPPLQGYRMKVTESNSSPQQVPADITGNGDWDGLWVAGPLLGLLLFWRSRHRGIDG